MTLWGSVDQKAKSPACLKKMALRIAIGSQCSLVMTFYKSAARWRSAACSYITILAYSRLFRRARWKEVANALPSAQCQQTGMFLPAAVSAIPLLRRRVLLSATIPLKTDGILCQAWTKRASGMQAVPWAMQCTYSVVKMATVSTQIRLRNWTEAGPSLPLQLFGKWSTCFLVRLQREYSRLFAFWTVRRYAYSVGRIVTMDC